MVTLIYRYLRHNHHRTVTSVSVHAVQPSCRTTWCLPGGIKRQQRGCRTIAALNGSDWSAPVTHWYHDVVFFLPTHNNGFSLLPCDVTCPFNVSRRDVNPSLFSCESSLFITNSLKRKNCECHNIYQVRYICRGFYDLFEVTTLLFHLQRGLFLFWFWICRITSRWKYEINNIQTYILQGFLWCKIVPIIIWMTESWIIKISFLLIWIKYSAHQ